MRSVSGILFVGGLLLVTSFTGAQPPGGGKGGKGFKGGKGEPGGFGRAVSVDELVTQMMAFDKNKDGKLTKEEITDDRLLRLFGRADANKDEVVTKEELTALFTKETAGGGDFGGPGFGPPGGFGGPGGPGGFGPPGGPPRPGQIMPPFLREVLALTDDQRKQLDTLQKEVDDKLDKILTDDQRKQLKAMRGRGPGGFGPPGGPPPGGPGGPPPGG